MAAPYDYSQYMQAPAAPGSYAADPYAQPPPGSYPPPMYAPPAAYGAPQAYGTYPPPAYGQAAPGTDEVRTIFITGFPADVKERELNNLLRFLPGYEASQMNWKNGQAQGFALFTSGALGRAACDAITQLCFDDTTVLRCEMARKNMYIKEDPTIKRPRTAAGFAPPVAAAAASYPAYASRPTASYAAPASGSVSRGNDYDNPPCNTLFIGNVGDNVTEADMRTLFGASPGFKFLKIVKGPRSTTCFVEYEDVGSAMAMHAANQGAVLPSSDRGPLRVQYSKNPYGKKRDVTGVLIDTLPRDYPAPGTS